METQKQTKLQSVEFREAKPVILAGFAPSRHSIADLDPGIDVWSCNHAWQYFPIERIKAIIEIHPWQYLNEIAYYANKDTAQGHIDFLGQAKDFPVYMIEPRDEVPGSVRYPIEAALELAGNRYFSSSFAYMIALAMLQDRNPIYVYGFDMATDTEWFYQRPNTEWWIGFAQGKGFDVQVSQKSPLCKVGKMYGYEGYQMVDRQVLEQRKHDYKNQFNQAKEGFDKWQGILLERHRLKRPQSEIEEAAKQARLYENTASMCDGALQAINNLLDECDLIPANIPVFQIKGVRE